MRAIKQHKTSRSSHQSAKKTDINTNNAQDEHDDKYYDDLDGFYKETDESRPHGTLELKINNISKFKDMDFHSETKIVSAESTMIRCLPWKILFMLHQERGVRCMGFFLQCNTDTESTTWHCQARAELRLVAQRAAISGASNAGGGLILNSSSSGAPTNGHYPTNSCQDIVKPIEHNFFYRENDWGFSNFLTWSELLNSERGFINPEDDSIMLRARVINADAPHGVDWDSKLHTGFVGLKNQGATCYMNSLLQALFFTNKLRAAVYQLPTDTDDEQRSVSLALQRVFYELQFGERAVGTKRLTKSFGWETLDTFMQHDAQELCRVLLDNLECKMKGTRVEHTIPTLFCGKMMSFVRCKNVPVESRREEAFYDVQLKVKGNSDIYKAFDEYVALETLDGDNKYDAGACGMQDAEKGIVFVRFPPVLYLQLMRFQYDYESDANIKINDRFRFPYRLDLSKYVHNAAATFGDDSSITHSPEDIAAAAAMQHNSLNQSTNCKYILHTVLVHSGDNHGGHYVAYLNPTGRNEWYKFDDDVVSRCSRRDAILSNYGSGRSGNSSSRRRSNNSLSSNDADSDNNHNGGDNDNDANDDHVPPLNNNQVPPPSNATSTGNQLRNCTNAYMLVYMCENELGDLLAPIDYADIPLNLHQRFANEKQVEGQKRIDKANAHLYLTAVILLDEDFYGWQGYELFDIDRASNYWRRIRLLRKSSASDTTNIVAEYLREKPSRIKIWCIFSKNNQIQMSLLESRESQMAITAHSETMSSSSSSCATNNNLSNNSPVLLWVQTLMADDPKLSVAGGTLLEDNSSTNYLLFTKYYNRATESIHYTGWINLRVPSTTSAAHISTELHSLLCSRARLPLSTKLHMWEERQRKHLAVLQLSQTGSIAPHGLYNGLIIVYEQEMGSSVGSLNASQFLEQLSLRVSIELIEKIGPLTRRDTYNKPHPMRFVVRLSLKSSYIDLVKCVSHQIQQLNKSLSAATHKQSHTNYNTDVNKIQLFRPSPTSFNTMMITASPGNTLSGSTQSTINTHTATQAVNGPSTLPPSSTLDSNFYYGPMEPAEPIRTTFDGTLEHLLMQSGQTSLTSQHIHSTLPRGTPANHMSSVGGRLLAPPLAVSTANGPTSLLGSANHGSGGGGKTNQSCVGSDTGGGAVGVQLNGGSGGGSGVGGGGGGGANACSHHALPCMFFQLLTMSITEMETMLHVNCMLLRSSTTPPRIDQMSVCMPRNARVHQLLTEALRQTRAGSSAPGNPLVVGETSLPPSTSAQEPWRVFELASHRIMQQLPSNYPLTAIETNHSVLLEPANEQEASSAETILVGVAHAQLDLPSNRAYFGTPFSVIIESGDTVDVVRRKIKTKMPQEMGVGGMSTLVSQKEFDKWNLVVMSGQAGSSNGSVMSHLYNGSGGGGGSNVPGMDQSPLVDLELLGNIAEGTAADSELGLSAPLVTGEAAPLGGSKRLFIHCGRPWLCLDHKLPSNKRTRTNATEKPIKIHN